MGEQELSKGPAAGAVAGASIPHTASESKALTGTQWITLAAAFLAWMFDGINMGLYPLIAQPALVEFLGPDTPIDASFSRIMACFLLGAGIGGISFGWVGDKIGRVRGLVLCMLMFSGFTGACYFPVLVNQPWHIGLCLFLSALGMGGAWSLAVALVMECWPERHRSKLAGLIGAAANFGFLFIALVALTRPVTVGNWRWMMLVGATPALLAVLIALVVPESERWKAAAKKGGRSPIIEVFKPGLRSKVLFAMAFSAIPLIGTWAAVSAYVPAWAEQLSQAKNWTVKLNTEERVQLESAHGYKERADYLSRLKNERPGDWKDVQTKSSPAKATVQMFMAIGAIIGCNLASLIGGIFGRRPAYFALCLMSLLSCGYLFWLMPAVFNWQFVLVAGLVGGITASFYGWLPFYLPELFPTRVRATGQGLSFNFGRFVAAAGTLSMSSFVALFHGDRGPAMGTLTLIYIVGMILIWFAPETKGKPLPE